MKKLWILITIIILTVLLSSCYYNIKPEIEEVNIVFEEEIEENDNIEYELKPDTKSEYEIIPEIEIERDEGIVSEQPVVMAEDAYIEGSILGSEKLVDLYSKPRENSDILKSIPESELLAHDIMKHEYVWENDQFILWDAYILDEDVIGYTISSYDSPREDLDVTFYIADRDELIANGYPEVDPMEIDNYYENIKFNEEGNMFFVEVDYKTYEPRDIAIQLFALENNKIISLYNEKISGYGYKNVKWNSNTEIEFDNYMAGYIDYFDASYQDLYSPQKLTVENGNVTKSEDNNQYEINKLRDDFMDNDEIILYKEISNQLKVVDKVYYSEIISSHITNTFSFVDSEIVVWYKIKTKNGVEAYTYKKSSENEEIFIYNGFVLTDDNSLLEVSDKGYLMRDMHKDDGYYLIENFDMSHYYRFINKNGIVDFDTNYVPIVSSSFHFIASTNWEPVSGYFSDKYKEEGNYFEIMAFNQLDVERMYALDFGEWDIQAVGWSGDTKINLRAINPNDGSEAYYYFNFRNGEWHSEDFPDTYSSKYYVSIDVDVLNIRSNPDMTASIVEEGHFDDRYIVLETLVDESGDYWYKIDENKWMASRYCRFSFEF